MSSIRGGDVDGARKAKRQLGAPGVVIDGLRQGDNVEALFAQTVGGLGGAVAAQHKQAVELQLMIGVDHCRHLLDAVGLGNIQALNGVRLVPRMVPPRVKRMPLKSAGVMTRNRL